MVGCVDGVTVDGAKVHCFGVSLTLFDLVLLVRGMISIATNVYAQIFVWIVGG